MSEKRKFIQNKSARARRDSQQPFADQQRVLFLHAPTGGPRTEHYVL